MSCQQVFSSLAKQILHKSTKGTLEVVETSRSVAGIKFGGAPSRTYTRLGYRETLPSDPAAQVSLTALNSS